MRWLYIILYLIVCIMLGAAADGLSLAGSKSWGHDIEAMEILALISGAFLFKLTGWRQWLLFLAAYSLMRAGSFDYLLNLFAGLEWSYLGNTGRWDRLLSQWPPGGLLFGRVILFLAGASIPIKYLRPEIQFSINYK